MLGLGLCQLPDYVVQDELARGKLVEVLPGHRPPPMPLSAVVPSGRLMPPRVRVLLDSWGSESIDVKVVTEMESSGIRVRWFRPLHRFRPGQVNHRTHRKVLVVDEAVGFTGGVGIADEWLGFYRHMWQHKLRNLKRFLEARETSERRS